MARTAPALPVALLALLLVLPNPAPAAEANIAGNWKITVLDQGDQPTLYILKFENKGGKWAGSVVASGDDVPEAEVSELSVAGDKVFVSLKIDTNSFFTFEGRTPTQLGAPIRGSINLGRNLFPAQLEATKLTALNPFELNKEIVARGGDDLRFFNAAVSLLNAAEEKKATPEEVRSWADKVFKSADAWGPRWQRYQTTRVAQALASQNGYQDLAVSFAQRAERLLDARDTPGTRFSVLSVLAAALKKAGKVEEARAVEAKLDQTDLAPKGDKFEGRKGKSDKTVLIELFTGAQCQPCVGAGLALEGLLKTYKPSEVIVLSYHLHGNGPDPLTNQDTFDRAEAYGEDVAATPTVLVNGRALAKFSGTFDDAPDLYRGIRRLIDPRLEETPKASLKVSAVQKGSKVNITADVSNLVRTGDGVRLKLALVEPVVRYVGGNKLRMHHQIVRAMPAGVKGVALTDKAAKKDFTVDLDDLRKSLNKYLDDFARKEEVKFSERPMDFKNLKVVAFIQDEQTADILQAAQADVRTE